MTTEQTTEQTGEHPRQQGAGEPPRTPAVTTMVRQLRELGVQAGSRLLVHSSYRSLGGSAPAPGEVFHALQQAVGDDGTLLFPALSYLQVPNDVHDTRRTPSNVGWLAEQFRLHRADLRSLHPTHSVCGIGRDAVELLVPHADDRTPVGPRSPFTRLLDEGGSILMLGCGLEPNTTMHSIEETAGVPYVLGAERRYTITDAAGAVHHATYVTHGFSGIAQRYDRLAGVKGVRLSRGKVLDADCFLIDAASLRDPVLDVLASDPWHFVDVRH